MGNAMIFCCQSSSKASIKLLFWEGTTRILTGKAPVAGEIMFEFPDRIVCNTNSFFLGQPVPALAVNDKLLTGQTYFVIPIDCFASNVLSASSLASLVSSPRRDVAINFKDTNPFQYTKDATSGKTMIKISPEFLINCFIRVGKENTNANPCCLCSTPELKKHYDMLVGSKNQVWSPKLDTISEYRHLKFLPRRVLGFEKKKERRRRAQANIRFFSCSLFSHWYCNKHILHMHDD